MNALAAWLEYSKHDKVGVSVYEAITERRQRIH